MASIVPRGKKRIYYAMWRDGDGRQWIRTTKLTDRKEAQSQADEWEKLSRMGPGEISAKNFHRVSAEIYERRTRKPLPKKTLREYAASWLQQRAGELSPNSMASYQQTIDDFVDGLGVNAGVGLHLITRDMVVEYRKGMAQGLAAGTVNKRLKIIRLMFTGAKLDELIADNPCDDIKRIKQRASDTHSAKPFTPAQLRQIIEKADDEWRSMVIHGYYTGQRLGDIAKMTADMIKMEQKQVIITTQKTGQKVITEMHPAYEAFCRQQLTEHKAGDPLHPSSHATLVQAEKQRSGTLSNRFARLLAKAGLREKPTNKKKEGGGGRSAARQRQQFSFHSLRHSMVSHLAAAGVSRSLVMDMVGHENAAVNINYTHFDAATKLEAMEKLPNII